MSMPELPDFGKLLAGILGSLVSLRTMQGSAWERALMFIGGCALSYYSTKPLSDWLGGSNLEGLISFVAGLLGMTIVAKLYEAIQALDAKAMAAEAWARFVRLLGGSK